MKHTLTIIDARGGGQEYAFDERPSVLVGKTAVGYSGARDGKDLDVRVVYANVISWSLEAASSE